MAWTQQRGARFTGLYRDPGGRTRSAGTFATVTEATNAAKAKEVDITRGQWSEPTAGHKVRGATLAEFAVPWIDRQDIGADSIANDRQYWKHLAPAFGHWPMRRITTRDVQDFIDAKADEGYAKGSREKMRNLLSKLYKAAARQSPPLVDHNPVPGVMVGKGGAAVERPYPTPDEVNAICAATDDDGTPLLETQDRLMVRTLYACGPRATELSRLDAGHLNAAQRTLYIPGTKSVAAARTVPVPSKLCAELAHLASARDPDDPLFLSVTGRRVNMSNWRPRLYNEARDAAGVAADVDLHALRHGALTNWARHRVANSLLELMEWSGHRDMRTMLRYQHFYSDITPGVADALDDLMAPPPLADVVSIHRSAR